MVMKSRIALFCMIPVILSGCISNEGAGTIAGGGIGALIGSTIGGGSGKVIAIAMGTLLGAVAGNVIGRQFDERDRMASSEAAEQAFDTGEYTSWENPQNGHRGEFRPQRTYYRDGYRCQDFSHLVYLDDGRPVTVHGTARYTRGRWVIVSR